MVGEGDGMLTSPAYGIDARLVNLMVGACGASAAFVARDTTFGVGGEWLDLGAGDFGVGACAVSMSVLGENVHSRI